ncbi:phosphoribosylformylglycinamidine synthase subunit PurS [Thermus sp. NMX2.A1]|uniref:phosphoribosylformylglycinamidine synthase subunit PurS n=1 Tax=Thermus sp. NMX2.A1 TaxID=570924 RepID=UPI0003DC0163|nr:phosphoribosylformylglycinamidine synthase subunit PurS [Thermus sp. NMX2.A1]ETN88200.1 phosphoribosylformylglycinamidine synthase [Thermus sp. NMX2.A1]
MPKYQATLLIELKEGILDPQGRAVEGVLKDLGHPVDSVRVGKVLEVAFPAETLLEAEEKARAMGKLLANPVMEVFTLEALKELP